MRCTFLSLIVLLAGGLFSANGAVLNLVTTNATWRYLKGSNEVSTPTTAWRTNGFDDATWLSGNAAFFYENDPASATAFTGSTQLPDMFGGYTSVFLRRNFNVANAALIQQLTLRSFSDDGFIAWINGVEVFRYNMPAGEIAATGVSLGALGEPIPVEATALSNPGAYLVNGNNVLCIHAFNSSIAGSSDFVIYAGLEGFVDDIAPVVSNRDPAPGSTVRELTAIEVRFSEDVTGVDAGDLLIAGMPATDMIAGSPSVYTFQFMQPPTGTVNIAFAMSPGIVDLAGNAFTGASWSYTLDPNAVISPFLITEFLASNSGNQTNSIRDENGDNSDWIEIYNPGVAVGNIGGWFLTDDITEPTKWRFPNGASVPGRGYLIVFASNKNRTNAAARLHTNFQLNNGGEYLALLDPMTNVISSFGLEYPDQDTDISYGRDRAMPNVTGYFTTPTPGADNVTTGAGFGPEVIYSVSGSTFTSPFQLSLSTEDTNSVIRYTLVTTGQTAANATNFPTATSLLYTNAITISNTVQVRARTFPNNTNFFPGPVHSENYLRLGAGVVNFTSAIPLVVIHTIGANSIPGGSPAPDASVAIAFFDNDCGFASLTNKPQVIKRAGINLRGSSTQGFPKSSFAVELWDEFNNDEDAEVLGLPAESDWVLYAPNQFDNVLLHNPFFLETARDTGDYASRTRFVEVFLNTGGTMIDANLATTGAGMGNYYGVFVLEEKVKRNKNRVDIDRLTPEQTNAPAITGGYLLKVDRRDDNERSVAAAGVPLAVNVGNAGIIFQDPDGLEMVTPARTNQYVYIRDYLNNFYSTITTANLTNGTGSNHYSFYFDIQKSIDFHMVNTFVLNVDAFRLSGYFYKPRGGKMVMGPAWDNDRGMGTSRGDSRPFNPRTWRAPTDDLGTDFWGNGTQPPWFGNLFRDPDFFQAWIDRWQDLRATVWTDALLKQRVDNLGNEVRSAQPREVARWGGNGASDTNPRFGPVSAAGASHTFPTPGTYQGELDFQKIWITNRLHFMQTQFLARPTIQSMEPAPGSFTITLFDNSGKAGTKLYYTLDGTDPRASQNRTNLVAVEYTGPITVSTNVRVTARAINAAHRNLTGANNPPLNSIWSGLSAQTLVVATPPLRVTELMYHPADPAPGNTNDSDNFEYIEVRNIGLTPLNVNRFRLRGGVDFTFSNVTLAAGQYAVIVRNQASFIERYGGVATILGVYTNDSLANEGEQLILEGGVREPILDFSYSDAWYPITDGPGFSLVIVDDTAATNTWGLKESWRPSGAFNGSPGQSDSLPVNVAAVVVNEVSPHTDPLPADAVELHNPTGSDVDVGDWYLTDNFGSPKKYRIPAPMNIPAGGYAIFYQSNSFGLGGSGFGISSQGEEIYLFSGNAAGDLTGYFDGHSFGAQFNGATFGRHVLSTGEAEFPSQSSPTLGATNSGPKVGPVIVSEIHYHPPDGMSAKGMPTDNSIDEFIELHNISGAPVPLFHPNHTNNTWLLRDAVDFTFPKGVTLPANGFALVVSFKPSDLVLSNQFAARFGVPAGVPVFGPFSGQLDNSEDSVELVVPDNPEPSGPSAGFVPYVLAERVHYRDVLPWTAGADGFGPTLQRIVESDYGNDPANWAAAGRTPGGSYVSGPVPVIVQQPQSQTNIAFMDVMFSVTASGAGPLSYQWRFNGSAINGANSSILALPNVQPSQAGVYSVIVLNPSGAVASSNATLTLLIPPRFTIQPTNQAWRPGSNIVFVASATSTAPPLRYQWQLNGVNILNATNPTYALNNLNLTNQGVYRVIATDNIAPTVSDEAMLTVLIRPLIVVQPVRLTVVAPNTPVTLTALITNTATMPVTYRWRLNGASIEPTGYVTNSTFTFYSFVAPNLQNSTNRYDVVVANAEIPGGLISLSATNITIPDTDGDGLPNAYETANGLSTISPDGNLDSDGDLMTNLEEYLAGTNPNNSNSYLKVDYIGIAPTNAALLQFMAVSNRSYTIEYTDTAGAPWNKLTSLPARTNNFTGTLTDPSPGSNRIYRLLVPAQP